jgi:hypothetical protein
LIDSAAKIRIISENEQILAKNLYFDIEIRLAENAVPSEFKGARRLPKSD